MLLQLRFSFLELCLSLFKSFLDLFYSIGVLELDNSFPGIISLVVESLLDLFCFINWLFFFLCVISLMIFIVIRLFLILYFICCLGSCIIVCFRHIVIVNSRISFRWVFVTAFAILFKRKRFKTNILTPGLNPIGPSRSDFQATNHIRPIPIRPLPRLLIPGLGLFNQPNLMLPFPTRIPSIVPFLAVLNNIRRLSPVSFR